VTTIADTKRKIVPVFAITHYVVGARPHPGLCPRREPQQLTRVCGWRPHGGKALRSPIAEKTAPRTLLVAVRTYG